jgi:hypothetical protein
MNLKYFIHHINSHEYYVHGRNNIQPIKKVIGLLILLIFFGCSNNHCNGQTDPKPTTAKSIKIAILLDTSNSMDGLIDQAKSQLWNIVNELAKAKCDGIKPDLKIALYEYGNSKLAVSNGYIRQVSPLTNDLDQISDDLFSLKTNGGYEYCGQVIESALKDLQWSHSDKDYQVVFIAGNEPFTQGKVDFHSSCADAKKHQVIVNTIFCGNFDEGVETFWKDGALLTGGQYLSIEQDRRTVYVETPYDDDIVKYNQRLNETYIYYGEAGQDKKFNQSRQDANAGSFGKSNMVSRTISKSSHVYQNSSWDLVDASKDKSFDVSKVQTEQLPSEMRKMNCLQQKQYIEKKTIERETIVRQIHELNIKREKYITEQSAQSEKGMLDNAIVESVKKQAVSKSFVF